MAISTKAASSAAAKSVVLPPLWNPFTDRTFKHGNVETDLEPHFLNGELVARITEDDGETVAKIIDANEPWHVDAYLRLTGSLRYMICGSLCFRLIGENIGPGGEDYEQMNDRGLIPLDPCGDGVYHAHFSVPANAVRVEHCGTPYELAVVATYLTPCKIRPDLPDNHEDSYRPGSIAGIVSYPMALFFDEGVEP